MTRSLLATLIAALAVLFLAPPSFASSSARKYATIDEKVIAEAIAESPHDYLAAVVEVVSGCELRRDDRCFDRVRILELLAQAPEPSMQRVVGNDFFLFSGKDNGSQTHNPPTRCLVFVIPMPDVEPTMYAASLMSVSVDAEAVDSLRSTIEGVVHK